MEVSELLGYVFTFVGGGGLAGLINWRINKRKANAEAKQSEVTVMAQAIREVYEPLVERQQKEIDEANGRIRDLEGQIEELKTERQTMQRDFEKRIQDLTKLIQATSNYPARGADGKFVKLSTEE